MITGKEKSIVLAGFFVYMFHIIYLCNTIQ